MNNSQIKHCIVFSVILTFCLLPVTLKAQIRPIYDQGAVGLGQLLQRLNNTKSVMHIGAHPDDEDSDLLAYLARAENARTVYLSLTRGDGGQNVIGSELFESLGVIRTEELLQARKLDGAEQLFTRAFDYGYSKTLAEAREKWDEKEILCDTVRAIRTFRPLVVISRFSGTSSDGHGQHQYAGYIAPLAVKAAADANQCQNSGMPWQVLKFYVSQGFRDTLEPTLKINTGKYDFLLGRSYNEIASEGRGQHKTQEQGGLELKGDRFSGMNLVWSKVPKIANEKSVFSGIDVSLQGLIDLDYYQKDFTIKELSNKYSLIEKVISDFDLQNPNKMKPNLLEIRTEITKILVRLMNSSKNKNQKLTERKNFNEVIAKRKEIDAVIFKSVGLQIDALANQETVTNGEKILTSVKVFYPENSNIKVKDIKLKTPNGWQVSDAEEPQSNSPFARFFRETANESKFFNVKVASGAKPTQPYFLEKEKENYLYKLNDDGNQNKPFQDNLMSADVTVEIDGTIIVFSQPVEYRYADDVRGEIRRNLNVVPKISLSFDQDLLVVPQNEKAQKRKIVLSVRNNFSSEISGKASLDVPENWDVSPAFSNFTLKNKGDKTSAMFDVTIPANYKIGDFIVSAKAAANGEIFTQTLNEIAYPHIQTHRFYTDAKIKAEVLDLKIAPVKIGYIPGSGDAIPEAIRQMGLNVEFLGENDLTNADFSKLDVIVVGIRASEVNQSFVANNGRLLDYVKNGGTLVVQYQKYPYLSQNLAPFPAEYNARVSEEDAKVTILKPDHPAFNFPNKITEKDFENWVQERNLYAFKTFDERYTPLLEAHDRGEPENKGGMLYAEIGKGKFVYTSYAFFRQLPHGVPGAYRLFANLLSLPKAEK